MNGYIPWSEGKRPISTAMMGFLARWARPLSWRQTARAFQTSWEAVYRSVEWFVQWGLAHRCLEGVQAIGIDEISIGKGHRDLTLILDRETRRVVFVGDGKAGDALRPFWKRLRSGYPSKSCGPKSNT